MKTQKIITLFIAILCSYSVFSQSNVTITSDNPEIRFFVEIDDNQMNHFYETWVKILYIPQGYHSFRVVFEGDSIADCTKKFLCKPGVEYTYTINEKKALMKELNNTGRQVGKKINVGKHDSTFNYLQDIYQLKSAKQEKTVIPDREIEVSTENTLSTSVLRATKKVPAE